MTIKTETPLIEPLFRIMGLPPSLVRYCPVSSTKPLRTIYLRDSPLVKGLDASWDDDCLLTTVDGEHDRLGHLKLSGPAAGKQVSGVHHRRQHDDGPVAPGGVLRRLGRR